MEDKQLIENLLLVLTELKSREKVSNFWQTMYKDLWYKTAFLVDNLRDKICENRFNCYAAELNEVIKKC